MSTGGLQNATKNAIKPAKITVTVAFSSLLAPCLTIGTEDPKPNTGPVEEGAGGWAKAVVEVELMSTAAAEGVTTVEASALLPEAII